MRKIRAKSLKAIQCTIIEGNEEFNGYRVELETEKTITYILITHEEFKPVLAVLREEKDNSEGFYI